MNNLRGDNGGTGGGRKPRQGRALTHAAHTHTPFPGMALVVGVDGGGTKTIAVAAKEGAVLGRGTAGASNCNSVGDTAADEAVAEAGASALKAAGAALSDVAAVACCLAGADDPGAAAKRHAALSALLPHVAAERIVISTDAAAPVAALRDGDVRGGMCLIAGTGCVAVAWSLDGTKHRVAGWGPALGDGGSAHALATRALSVALEQHDGRRATPADGGLVPPLLAALGLANVDALIPWAYAKDRTWADVAALAPVVCERADNGDAEAAACVDDTAAELVAYVRAAASRAGFTGAFDVALCGGMLESGSRVARSFLARLASSCRSAHARVPPSEPALGAAHMARRLLVAR